MAPEYLGGGMLPEPIGFTSTGRPVYPIAGAEDGGGGTGDGGGSGEGGGSGDQIDPEAAKAAIAVVEKMKAAGVEDPSTVLDLVGKLRDFEKGAKLPKTVERELKELRDKLAKADSEKLSETERLAKEIERLTASDQKAQTRVGRAALKAAAAAAHAVYPEDIAKLIDVEDLEFDDDGEPTNAQALVDALKKSRPALFGSKAGSHDGGARGTGTPKTADMNELLRAAAGH